MSGTALLENPNLRRTFVEVAGHKLFVLDTDTEGPTILCLHGRFGRAETWTALMQRYAGRYRIVAPDQRGHGLSDQPVGRYTADEMAADAAAVIEHFGGVAAIVVGHSMGGRIAGYLAAQHPSLVAAVAILDQSAAGPRVQSSLPLAQLPAKDSFTSDWPIPFASLRQAREFLLQKTNSSICTNYYLDSLVEKTDGYHLRFSQPAMAAIFEYQQDWFHLLPDIWQPTLLVAAHASVELPSDHRQKMEQLLPAATSAVLSRPEHHVYLSDPEEFYQAFDAFLQRIGSSGGTA